MSLEGWKDSGWLREHETSAKEISGLMALVERDLTDAAREEISTDWRFNIAYNAGLQLATTVLSAAGYRAGKLSKSRIQTTVASSESYVIEATLKANSSDSPEEV